MAARRVAKSAVDWTAFAERVPVSQREAFRAFKAKCDGYVMKVHRSPENLPTIDFAQYASRLSNPALAAEFEKQYKAVSVPYPKDKKNLKAEIDSQEKQAQVASKEFIAELQKETEYAKTLIEKIKSLPKPEEMTHEMYVDYFPYLSRNPRYNGGRVTMWPHTKSYQPENDPHVCS